MTYTFFNSPFNLAEITINAGSYQEFTFAIYDSSGNPVSLSGASRKRWYLRPFSDSTALVIVDGVSGSASNIVSFVVTGSSTSDLSGKYIQQYEIIDSSGSSFRPSTGIINVFRASV